MDKVIAIIVGVVAIVISALTGALKRSNKKVHDMEQQVASKQKEVDMHKAAESLEKDTAAAINTKHKETAKKEDSMKESVDIAIKEAEAWLKAWNNKEANK